MIFTAAAAVCTGLAMFLAVPGDERRRRLARILAGAPSRAERPGGTRSGVPVRLAVSGLAGLSCAVLVGGWPGWLAGALAAIVCVGVLGRFEPREVRQRRSRIVADLPLAADLLAACLRAGGSWHESVEAVADAVRGPLGAQMSAVAARTRLGADPAQEWLQLSADPVLAPLGRAAARAEEGGAPLADTLARLARTQRRRAKSAASARARTAGVRAAAPLGLCFLPAFVLLGIVPAVAGIAAGVLHP